MRPALCNSSGSAVGVVCGSQRGVESIAEVLQLAGTTGVRIISAVAHTQEELDRVDREADIVLLSREAIALADARGDDDLRSAALFALVEACYCSGDYDAMLSAVEPLRRSDCACSVRFFQVSRLRSCFW